mgnify:CR=1 FL=1
MSNQPNHAAKWPVTCDHCGELHFAVDPLRPTCDECEAALREMFADAIREIPTDDDASRYEAEMEARHG